MFSAQWRQQVTLLSAFFEDQPAKNKGTLINEKRIIPNTNQ
jgi:hypothetical protein